MSNVAFAKTVMRTFDFFHVNIRVFVAAAMLDFRSNGEMNAKGWMVNWLKNVHYAVILLILSKLSHNKTFIF